MSDTVQSSDTQSAEQKRALLEKLLKEKSNIINSELLETMKNAEKQLINDSQTNLASKLSKYITLAENIHNQTN